jgi:outer membrane immunogenic protein
MKKFLLATVALAMIGAALPVHAADLGARAPYYNKAPAYMAPIYNWTGFYVGGHIGGAFSSDNNFSGLATGNNGNGRFLGGVQVGADWQFAPNWVLAGPV